MTKSNTCLFATVLCLIPENVYGRPKKLTGKGLAAGCQLFYRKIYGYISQCSLHCCVIPLGHKIFEVIIMYPDNKSLA